MIECAKMEDIQQAKTLEMTRWKVHKWNEYQGRVKNKKGSTNLEYERGTSFKKIK